MSLIWSWFRLLSYFMIGGGGTNYFDYGPNGNAVILDFNPKNGDTKVPNCKYTISSKTGVVPLPPVRMMYVLRTHMSKDVALLVR